MKIPQESGRLIFANPKDRLCRLYTDISIIISLKGRKYNRPSDKITDWMGLGLFQYLAPRNMYSARIRPKNNKKYFIDFPFYGVVNIVRHRVLRVC